MTQRKARRGLAAIVPAAGRGTRMRSSRAKVLHRLGGEPILVRALRCVQTLKPQPFVLVTGHQGREVEDTARSAFPEVEFRVERQIEQRGTGDAVRCGLHAIPAGFGGDVLITYGDLPRVRPDTIAGFLDAHRDAGASLSFISVRLENPSAYGRVIRDSRGKVRAIVESADASPHQLRVNEINTGVYLTDAAFLRAEIETPGVTNATGEHYLTDLVARARERGLKVLAWPGAEPQEFGGINSREELASMEAEIRRSVNERLMAEGVTLVDPATAYISEQARIAPDCTIGPNVQILGRSRIGRGVTIEGTAYLRDVTVGPRCRLKLGVRAEECRIGEDCDIGPFANLRPGTELEGQNRIGNFVETKKASIGRGTKASHLTYLGDVEIGRETNVGCGVITVNYDGYEKHLTRIGDRCMIGCDSQLVAPVKVGSDVYVASGTTIVRDVEDGALVLSHHPQRTKPGWTAEWRKRHGGGAAAGEARRRRRARR